MIFTTWFVIAFGLTLMVIYLIWLLLTKRKQHINLPSLGSIFLQGSSIIGGLKLMYYTFLPLWQTSTTEIAADKIYTFYGGICVIYISIITITKKFSVSVT